MYLGTPIRVLAVLLLGALAACSGASQIQPQLNTPTQTGRQEVALRVAQEPRTTAPRTNSLSGCETHVGWEVCKPPDRWKFGASKITPSGSVTYWHWAYRDTVPCSSGPCNKQEEAALVLLTLWELHKHKTPPATLSKQQKQKRGQKLVGFAKKYADYVANFTMDDPKAGKKGFLLEVGESEITTSRPHQGIELVTVELPFEILFDWRPAGYGSFATKAEWLEKETRHQGKLGAKIILLQYTIGGKVFIATLAVQSWRMYSSPAEIERALQLLSGVLKPAPPAAAVAFK